MQPWKFRVWGWVASMRSQPFPENLIPKGAADRSGVQAFPRPQLVADLQFKLWCYHPFHYFSHLDRSDLWSTEHESGSCPHLFARPRCCIPTRSEQARAGSRVLASLRVGTRCGPTRLRLPHREELSWDGRSSLLTQLRRMNATDCRTDGQQVLQQSSSSLLFV